MICSGSCNQGRNCDCWQRDSADKSCYRSPRAENVLVLCALAYFVLLVALGLI